MIETHKISGIAVLALLIISIVLLPGCSLSEVTGNLISGPGKDECINGAIVDKVMKGDTIKMCCFASESETKEIEVCNSFDFLYSETTVFIDSEISQRKVTYPIRDMSCTDTYGKLPGAKDLALIEDLSTCEKVTK
jgi:hypothetical protein